VEIHVDTTLESVSAEEAVLGDGTRIPTNTLVWTAGVAPNPLLREWALPLDEKGRVEVDEVLRVRGHEQVWALGDCAAVPDAARPGQPCPPTAQHALRQGRLVAKNIAAALSQRPPRSFEYRTKGVVAELGRSKAVAITLGVRWQGLAAWIIARTYHLLMLPGLGRRLRLLVDWNVALVFGRDVSDPGPLGDAPSLHGELGGV